METSKLAWPQDRRLFRRPRLVPRGFPVTLAILVAVAVVYTVSGWA